MKNIRNILIFALVLTILAAFLLCGCSEEKSDTDSGKETSSYSNPGTKATLPDGTPEKEGVVGKEEDEPPVEGDDPIQGDDPIEDELPEDTDLPVVIPGVDSELPDDDLEGGENEELAPPFYDDEPGIDDGDWGAIH